MRRLLIAFASVALVLAVGYGCGKKESGEPAGKVPTEVKKAETMDSTRLDSAMMDTTAAESTAAEKSHDSL